jgi:hypothetical protein
LYINVSQITRANCTDTTTQYRIDVTNGQAPYTFKIDGGSPTTNNIATLRNGFHNIIATDAAGCRNDSVYNADFNIQYQNDSISMRYTFVPTITCGNIGTLNVNPDASLPRPFSASLNGRAYVSDSVLRNITLLNGFNTILFKTAAGCIYQNRFIYSQPVNPVVNYTTNYNSCGVAAPLSINYPIINGITCTFRLDSVASVNNTWQNVLPGLHLLSYTTSTGCVSPDFNIFLNTTNNISLRAYEQTQQRTCLDSVRPFRLDTYNGQAPYTFSVNNSPFVSTSIVLLRNGLNYITVKDANGCQVTNYPVSTQFALDSVAARQTFVPNTTCDSIGTYTISVTDPNLQRPLSFSIDGVTFTSDSVFTNVNISRYSLVGIRTAQGCLYKIPRLYYPRTTQSLRYYYSYNSSCNQPATFSVTVLSPTNTSYVFRLDGVASATNTWQNVSPGRHTLGYSINGCSSLDTVINLASTSLYVYTEQQPLRSCADTLYSFKLKVVGGRAPYTFRIDNGAATTDTIVFLREGRHFINVVDAFGCRSDSIYNYVYYQRDSVAATTTFTPNSGCGDSTGTLRISVNSPNIARPFTISVNGRPFTSDTIFRNIANYGYFPYVVRSAQGCLYYGRTDYYNANRLEVSIYDTCANRLGRGNLKAYASGGLPPYKFEWSNGALGANLNDVRIGTYKVFVTDVNNCQVESQVTLTTCVWAGDTDTSGVVNAADLLNIGLAFGERGRSRPYCGQDTATVSCTAWQPNNFSFWSKQTPTNVNFKHIDADGNGIINHKDTLAITANWQKTRNVRGNGNPLEVRGAAPPIFVQTGRVVEGQWASFPIMLGDVANAANGIYGLAFSINYDASVIDASTVYLTYNQNWLGSGDNVVRISKNFNGTIEAAVSRINQQNASGNGQIATLNFKMKAGTVGRNLAFSIDNQQVINKDAQVIPVVPTPTSTSILSGTAEPDWARQIEVFPNPTTGNVNIEGQNLDIKSVEVFDISGKSLFKSDIIGKGGPPEEKSGQAISIEHAGTYFLKISTEKGVLMRKLIRL